MNSHMENELRGEEKWCELKPMLPQHRLEEEALVGRRSKKPRFLETTCKNETKRDRPIMIL